MRSKVFVCLCAAVASASSVIAQTPPQVRIMPLGDSITLGSSVAGGYRLPLYIELTNAGYNVDYIGNETGNSAAGLGTEINHEGHSGWRISASSNGLYENILDWLDEIDDPDVVLLHIGTNDTGDAAGFPDAINKLDALIGRIATARPYAHIVVTTLMKRGADDNDNQYKMIRDQFNPFVPGVVAAHQQLGRRVHFLDMHAYLERSDMPDNLHPGAGGYAKMADAWYPVVTNLVGHYGNREAPDLWSVKRVTDTTFTAIFSKPLDVAASPDLVNPASYTLVPAGRVTAVSGLSDDLREVTLTVADLPPNAVVSVTFSGWLTDLTPAAENGPISLNVTRTHDVITPPVSGFAEDNIPVAVRDGWEPLHTLAIPTSVRYGRDPVGYTLDTSADYAAATLSKVAYYMALQREGELLQYVWVEMDAFTQDAGKLGVPTTASGAFFQRPVSNLRVFSNSPNITQGEFAAGNIEFWPCNYHQRNSANVQGASADVFDFGDDPTDGDYGSMQVHNTALRQTLFAFNHWGIRTTGWWTPCLGLGNNPNASSGATGQQSDWTFRENAREFNTRVLQVFVKRGAPPEPPEPPAPLYAYMGYDGAHIAAAFSRPLIADSVVPGAFTLDNGVEVIDAKLSKDRKTVNLTTTPYGPGATLTLTVSGVLDGQTGVPAPAASVPVAALPPQIAEDAGSLADGYRVVYTLDIPVSSDFGGTAIAPYAFNATDTDAPFSRVAYYLELGQRPLMSPARQYVWTSMDAFTPFISKIGIPNAAAKTVFAQIVTNLTFKSNKSSVTNGTYETGNIEFWPSNYNGSNPNGIPGASSDNYDFGDGNYSTSAGHGSFQVHNYLKKYTVFSLTHWGRGGSDIIGVGIGASPKDETTNGADKDWTFAYNSPSHSYRRLHVLAHLRVDTPPSAPPAEVTARVPEAAGYKHLYTVDIPLQPKFNNDDLRPTYYSVDNSMHFAGHTYERVAYFLELVDKNDPSITNYCWTAFDPISTSAEMLAVPYNEARFWQTVTNLDVRSNVAGIVNTNGCDTGNIEFWGRDYTAGNGFPISGASGSAFDFGDTPSASGSYGSMQVHNYGAGQTLWAMSRFGNCSGGDSVCIGIGNNSDGAPDWTHTNSGANWLSRRLLVFIKPVAPPPEIPPEVTANVPDAAAYTHLYTIDIPVRAQFNGANFANYYSVNNAARYNGSISRVAYYMELVEEEEMTGVLTTNYCWTAFDTFTQDPAQLGVPRGSPVFQQYVRNLDVRSNKPGVVNTTGCNTGNIEFWSYNYTEGNNLGIPGASGGTFDFGDTPSSSGSYGSMQVHNHGAGQTLWAFNRFNTSADDVCIGIGNNPNGSPDWTHTSNAGKYTSRRLLVFVLPEGGPGTTAVDMISPALSRAIGQTSLNRALVFFNEPVEDAAANPANFTADNGLAILGAEMHPVYSGTCVILTTSPQTAGTKYTIAVSDVCDRSPQRNAINAGSTVSFTAQAEADARPDFLSGISEASGYRLVLKLAVDRPTTWTRGAPYSLDDTWPAMPHFDRVAYALDLTGTNNVRQWVWVSMDAFTTDPLRIGLPTADRVTRFQQYVHNLTVAASSTANVTPGAYADGNIEFWPNDYSRPAGIGIPGSNNSAYDFDDLITASVPVGFGSFQVHNYRHKQTLLAVNNWASGSQVVELGIGNSEGANASDWTQTGAYSTYAKRTLYVFVRPSAAPVPVPAPVPGWGVRPTIVVQPEDQRVEVGESATFKVATYGAERFQWRKDGVPIPGATSFTLTIPFPRHNDIGDYDVLVYGNGSIYETSLPARLLVRGRGSALILK